MLRTTRLRALRTKLPHLLLVVALVASGLLAAPAGAQSTPTCASASSDSDGDGWGWENNQSCIVGSSTNNTATSDNCDYSAASQNNGWGYDSVARQSCPPRTSVTAADVAPAPAPAPAPTPTPAPSPAVAPTLAPDAAVIGDCNIVNGQYDSYLSFTPSGRQFLCESLTLPATVTAKETFPDGSQTIMSETAQGEGRIVNIDPQGRVEVTQLDQNPNTSSGFSLSAWHFENREDLNVNLPIRLEDAAVEGNGWNRMPHSQAALHQDPNVPGNEIKFVHDDGREAVYYSHGPLATDPAIAGTFNYINPRALPETADVGEWIAFGWYGLGHVIVDVLPWGFGDNVRGPDPDPNGPTLSQLIDLHDDDDDGIPARDDIDDKDPNQGARPGTPSAISIEITGEPDSDGGEFDGLMDSDSDGFPDVVDSSPFDDDSHDARETNDPFGPNNACGACP